MSDIQDNHEIINAFLAAKKQKGSVSIEHEPGDNTDILVVFLPKRTSAAFLTELGVRLGELGQDYVVRQAPKRAKPDPIEKLVDQASKPKQKRRRGSGYKTVYPTPEQRLAWR